MDTLELIDKYIDGQLPQNQAQQLEKSLQHDADLQNLLDSIIVARRAVQFRGLTDTVRGLHKQCMEELRAAEKRDNVFAMPVERSFSWTVRVAASILLVLVGYGSYQFATLDSTTVYSSKFISYQLPTTRSYTENVSRLSSLYRSGNYTAVIHDFSMLRIKEPVDYFLTGVSYLQQNEYQQAVNTFTILRQYNRQHTQAYFDQETDYYLALAYLGANRIDEAYTLLNTIHDTPRHLFGESVTKLDLLKVDALKLKQ